MLTLLCPICGASIVAIASGGLAWHEKPLCVPVAKHVTKGGERGDIWPSSAAS